jgi:hypothetical protein
MILEHKYRRIEDPYTRYWPLLIGIYKQNNHIQKEDSCIAYKHSTSKLIQPFIHVTIQYNALLPSIYDVYITDCTTHHSNRLLLHMPSRCQVKVHTHGNIPKKKKKQYTEM